MESSILKDDDSPAMNLETVQEAMKRAEREKHLENQLIASKRDKDKAVRLIIQLIGKVSQSIIMYSIM